MHTVDIYQANITDGDCMYIPFSWYHQLNSHDSNIAVSINWRHDTKLDQVLAHSCPDVCKQDYTMDKVKFMGTIALDEHPERVK